MMRRSGAEWTSFRTARVGHLLGYLCLHHDRAVAREHLASLFWPEANEKRARQNLRSVIYFLRKAIESTRMDAESLLTVDRSTVRLNAEAACWIDVLAFQAKLQEAEHAASEMKLALLEAAVGLYREDFLADCYDDWCLRARERLRTLSGKALHELTLHYAMCGQPHEALRYGRAWLATDPLDENRHRHVMYLRYAVEGRHAALDQYEECRRTLRAELDVAPDGSTTDVAELIEADAATADVAQAIGLAGPDKPSALPSPLTSFVGRTGEMEAVKDLLSETRLLTLTGIGGVGKTRLAREIADALRGSYDDGVWWIGLEDLTEPALLPDAIASTLGIRQSAGQTLAQTLHGALQGKQMLLILDNLEHLIDESARVIEGLLHAAPRLTVLATSREPLGIHGEVHWDVPPLELPDPDRLPSSAEQLLEYDAIRLFCERTRSHVREFDLTPDNIREIVQICRYLDGIPLSIELATARTRALSLRDIHRRLDDRFQLLSGDHRTSIPRHRTLRATMDWSYELLSEHERLLLRRLTVFAGAFTLDAIEAICTGDDFPQEVVLDLLARLVAKSLVRVERDAEGWYHVLGTVKQYAWEKLTQSEDPESLRDRHLDYYVRLAREAEGALKGDEQRRWLEMLDRQADNVRAALQWALSAHRDEQGMALIAYVWRFWDMRGGFHEGRRWIDRALVALSGARIRDRARVLNAAGVLAFRQGDFEAARRHYQECLAALHDHNEEAQADVAMALNNLGMALRAQGEYARALRLHQRSLEIRRQRGSPWDVGMTLINIGNVHYAQGNYETAQTHHQQALDILRRLGDDWGIAIALGYQGLAAYARGDYERARSLLDESLTLRRALDDRHGIAGSLNNLANVALAEGAVDNASDRLAQSVRLFQDLGDQEGLADCLDGFARLRFEQGRFVLSTQLFAKEKAVRDAVGMPLVSFWTSAIVDYDHYIVQLRTKLGNDAFNRAWKRGMNLPLSIAIDAALSGDTPAE